MSATPHGLTMALVYSIDRTNQSVRLIACHGVDDARRSATGILASMPGLVFDATSKGRPHFGHCAEELPTSTRAWLESIPASSYAVLPLAGADSRPGALLLLGLDPKPLSHRTRTTLLSATAMPFTAISLFPVLPICSR
jgi:hypothetical protein